jgi:hypothetical protein
MDETGVMLSSPSSLKVPFGKQCGGSRVARANREVITAIEFISADGRAGNKPRLLVTDGFGIHESLEVLGSSYQNNIIRAIRPHVLDYSFGLDKKWASSFQPAKGPSKHAEAA